ncbi:MAG: AbrB/MazE/SpoVT family DNA-binding domain-containing protein [Candidatus Paceibacterota bacterium]|jgi:AbrB family looped-hinge helix DNA binding protein
MKTNKKEKKFYGLTTIGEKGQVVVPALARKAMSLKKGEKLLVFGRGQDMVGFCKLANLEKLASHLTEQLGTIKGIIRKTKAKRF